MLDISFTELVVIGVVALVVVGPERLPGVARTLGHLLGRAQRYVSDVKADISREMQLEELKKLQSQMAESAENFENSVRQEVTAAHSAFVSPAQEALADLAATANIGTSESESESATASAPLPPASEAVAAPAAVLPKPERPAA